MSDHVKVTSRFDWIAEAYRKESNVPDFITESGKRKNLRKRRFLAKSETMMINNQKKAKPAKNVLEITFNAETKRYHGSPPFPTQYWTGNKIVCENCDQLFTKQEKYSEHCTATGHGTGNMDDVALEFRTKELFPPHNGPVSRNYITYDVPSGTTAFTYNEPVGRKFIVPAFYCKICAQVFHSLEDADSHAKSPEHSGKFMLLRNQNPFQA